MKTVWIINHYGEPPGPGKFTRHFNFAQRLLKEGYRVKIFTASTIHTTDINYIQNQNQYKEMTIEGVDFVFIKAPNYRGNGLGRVRNILSFARRVFFVTRNFEPADIVYASSPHSLTWLSAYYIAKRTGAEYITETRDLWPETFVAMGKIKRNSLVAKVLYKLERFIYEHSEKIVFTLPGGKDYIKSLGLPTDNVYYINNGIDLESFDENTKIKFEDTDLSNDQQFNLVFTGAFGAANDLMSVLESFKLLQERGIEDIKLLLFGGGGQEEELKAFVRDHQLKNVVFKGRVEKKQIPSILKQSDLLLLSLAHLPDLFKYGLSPNKLFEYLASGRPVLSNVVCGYDILEETGSGKTVTGDNAQALIDGILYFKNLPKEEFEEYGQRARQTAEKFDFDILTNQLIDVFEYRKGDKDNHDTINGS